LLRVRLLRVRLLCGGGGQLEGAAELAEVRLLRLRRWLTEVSLLAGVSLLAESTALLARGVALLARGAALLLDGVLPGAALLLRAVAEGAR
jgi:hypothetical protein